MNQIISVIIPVYNIADYLSDCLDSVMSQTYSALEIILVNDGSTDRSAEICESYAKKDPRIKLFLQENSGLSAARNSGVEAATGDYIAFVDGDDILHPDYFKVLISAAEQNGADVSVVKYVFIRSREEFASMKDLKSDRVEVLSPREAVLRIERDSERYMIIACGKLFSRNLREMIRFEEGKLHEDEFFTYRLLYQANRVAVSDCRYYGYLKRGTSIMGHFSEKRMEDALEGMIGAIAFFEEQKDEELYACAVRRYLFRILIDYYRIRREAPEDRDWAEQTEKLFRREYARLFPITKKGTSFTYAAAFHIFMLSPKLYCVLCDVFLRHAKD